MSLRVLLLGDGGREHALAWKLAESSLVAAIFVVPGNSGTAHVRNTVNLECHFGHGALDDLAQLVRRHHINFVVPTQEEHLVMGLTDFFQNRKCFPLPPLLSLMICTHRFVSLVHVMRF
jgi:phosphoribosylamine-glycine ligase